MKTLPLLKLLEHAGNSSLLFGRKLWIRGSLFELIDAGVVIGLIDRFNGFVDGGLGSGVSGLEAVLQLDRIDIDLLAATARAGNGQEQSQGYSGEERFGYHVGI